MNVAVLLPCVVPKLSQQSVTVVPPTPVVGDKPEITTGSVNVITIAGQPAHRHHHVARSSFWRNFVVIDVLLHVMIVAGRSIECHCAAALRRTEVRTGDRHRIAYRAGG